MAYHECSSGESPWVGDGNEIAHIDLILGPRGSAAETAFCTGLVNNKDGFTSLLAVVSPNVPAKAQHDDVQQGHHEGRQARRCRCSARPSTRSAGAVMDAVSEGTIPADEADDLYICVGVFIHWEAEDDAKDRASTHYQATKEAIERRGGRPALGAGCSSPRQSAPSTPSAANVS